ncbi:hypothetical protein LA080_000402 [Diaporthe eres]|nr:hypothetical protein LA080_000402 [Diaporthe eres]
MAQPEHTLKAMCACGMIKHEVCLPETEFPIDFHYTSCRQTSGGLCFTSIPLLSEREYRPNEELSQQLTGFEFSKDRITHYFFPVCRMHMPARILPKDSNTTIDLHEYVEDTIDGGITNAVQFLNNKPVARPSLSWIPADKLHARCKCRGVGFWVTRSANGLRSQVKLGHRNSCRLDDGMESYATATFEVESDQIFLDQSGFLHRARILG